MHRWEELGLDHMRTDMQGSWMESAGPTPTVMIDSEFGRGVSGPGEYFPTKKIKAKEGGKETLDRVIGRMCEPAKGYVSGNWSKNFSPFSSSMH